MGLGIDIIEHRLDAVFALLGKDAELLRLFLRGTHCCIAFGGHCRVPFLVPFADRDQVRLQPLDRIA